MSTKTQPTPAQQVAEDMRAARAHLFQAMCAITRAKEKAIRTPAMSRDAVREIEDMTLRIAQEYYGGLDPMVQGDTEAYRGQRANMRLKTVMQEGADLASRLQLLDAGGAGNRYGEYVGALSKLGYHARPCGPVSVPMSDRATGG